MKLKPSKEKHTTYNMFGLIKGKFRMIAVHRKQVGPNTYWFRGKVQITTPLFDQKIAAMLHHAKTLEADCATKAAWLSRLLVEKQTLTDAIAKELGYGVAENAKKAK